MQIDTLPELNDDIPMAMSAERIRHEMLRGILVPREMVNNALLKVNEKLHAKETKFFSYKGEVTETHNVEDHAIQMQAADTILTIAGLYKQEDSRRGGGSLPSGFALEIDQHSGVIRLVSGSLPFSQEPSLRELAPSVAEIEDTKVPSMEVKEPEIYFSRPVSPIGGRKPHMISTSDINKVIFDELVD